MKKHAYLILAHTNKNQLSTLLSLIDDERNDIYVHIDAKAGFGPSEFEGCCKHSQLTFIKREKLSWGGVSLVRAEMNLLKAATESSHSYYHLLSGMDLPIKPLDEIFRFFEENEGKEFLDCWKMKEHTLKRVKYYTLFPEGNRFFLTNWLNHLFKAILEALGIEMNKGVVFRQASQWFSITENFARYIVDNAEWVEKTFGHACLCDEIVVPTLLERSPYKDNIYLKDETVNHAITSGNMRLIDWSRGESIRHPWVFTTADYDFLRQAPQFWARKFDERVDSEIIDRIASMVSHSQPGA